MLAGAPMSHSTAISAPCCRSRCGAEPRCSLYANPPFSACVVKAQEPVRVQTFASELAVERFDEAVVRRLSRPREIQHDTLLVSPDIGSREMNSDPWSTRIVLG